MEKPVKPELETQTINGAYGELVEQLTPDSEQAWNEYMIQRNMYRQAFGYLALMEDKLDRV